MKADIRKAVREGTPLRELIDLVYATATDEAVILCYGNQTAAARMLGCNRATMRKYLTGSNTPRPGAVRPDDPDRWRENNGRAPVRRGLVEIEFIDGETRIGHIRHYRWSLTRSDSDIKRWRPHHGTS